jgi:hypothetical protein
MALQMSARQTDGAADEILALLLEWAATSNLHAAANLYYFGCRLLELLEPRESTVRAMVHASGSFAIDPALLGGAGEIPRLVSRPTAVSPREIFQTWHLAATENLNAVGEALDNLFGSDDLSSNAVLQHFELTRTFDEEDPPVEPALEFVGRSLGHLRLIEAALRSDDLHSVRYSHQLRWKNLGANFRPKLLEELFMPAIDRYSGMITAPDSYMLLSIARRGFGYHDVQYVERLSLRLLDDVRAAPAPWFVYGPLIDEHFVGGELLARGWVREIKGMPESIACALALVTLGVYEASALASGARDEPILLSGNGVLGSYSSMFAPSARKDSRRRVSSVDSRRVAPLLASISPEVEKIGLDSIALVDELVGRSVRTPRPSERARELL